MKNTLAPFSQLYSLLACVVFFKTFHGPNKAPAWFEYSSITIGWELHPLSVQDLKKHFTTILSGYTAFVDVLFLRHTMGQIKPHRDLNTLQSLLAENCTPCLFRTWKKTLAPFSQLYSLLACVVFFKTFHGPNKAPLWLEHSSVGIGWELHPLSVHDLKNTLAPFSQLYSLLACVVFLRHAMGQIKLHCD